MKPQNDFRELTSIIKPQHHEEFQKHLFKESAISSNSISSEPEDLARKKRFRTLLVEIPARLICFLCNLLMEDPIQTSEGRLACKECFDVARSEKSSKLAESELVEMTFKDRATALEIRKLRCACENRERGCAWEGILGDSKDHVSSCMFSAPKCPFCDDTLTKTLDGHLIHCKFLEDQKKCPYEGCNFKVDNVNGLLEHLKNASFFHLSLHGKHMLNVKNEISALQSECSSIQREFSRKANEHKNMVTELNLTIDKLNEQSEAMKDQIAEFSAWHKQIKHSKNNKESAKKPELLTISKTLSVLEENTKELELHQQILENTSYNGKLLWKIDNFTSRRESAKAGEGTVLHSAPCFASRYGFKFCGRLYLNGDGAGKHSHISLFFVLMKSEYDNLLKWPFQDRITFKLTTQDDSKKTVTESFLPDKQSVSFKKPEKNMNVAAGFPLFISIEELQNGGYVRDDSFFIEILVQKR